MTARPATALAALLLAATLAPPAPAAPAACDAIVRPDTAYALSRALREPAACAPARVDIAHERITVAFPAGTATVRPAACAPDAPTTHGPWALTLDPAVPPACAAALAAALASPAIPPPSTPPPTAAPAPPRPPLLMPQALYVTHLLPALWLLFLLVAASQLAARLRAHGLRRPTPDTALTLAITALALTLRAALPTWGPGDVSHAIPFAYLGPAAIHELSPYGSALDALALLAFRVLPTSDTTIATLALLASAASPALLTALARRLGYPRLATHAAALLLATTPLLVRYAPTVDRYSFLIFTALTALTALLAYLQERRPTDLALATLAVILGTQLRPDALWLPPAAAGLVLAYALSRRRLAPAPPPPPALPLALAAAVTALALLEPAATLAHALRTGFWPVPPAAAATATFLVDPAHNIFLASAYTPLAWPALAAVGLFRPPAGRLPLHLWVLVMAVGATFLGAVHAIDFNISSTRYQLPAQPFFILLAAAALAWPPRRVAIPLTLAAAALTVPALSRTTAERTFQAEYRFLRAALAELPDDCAIVTFSPNSTELGLRPNHQLSATAGRRHRWYFDHTDPTFAAEPCQALYVNASCDADCPQDAANQRLYCVTLRAQASAPIAEATLPNRALLIRDGYRHAEVPVSLHWLRRPD